MTSWFGSAGLDLNSAFDTLTETVQSVTESVSEAIPTEHKEFLAKITLNTDEMISERQNFREEAFRKAQAKDSLNKILPWETLDAEREILVEECKEVILELSSQEETFFGPYEMPLLKVVLQTSDDEDEIEDGDEETEQHEEDTEANDESAEEAPTEDSTGVARASQHMAPSEESLEMLKKLEPLPPLLEGFDLDAHVGLIQRVMKEDPKLVAMQANFSGGGLREQTFWRNYFFHCAFTRYEAGLSIDEIWSYGEELPTTANHDETTVADSVVSSAIAEFNEEEAVNGNENDVEESAAAATTPADETVDLDDTEGTADSPTDLSELSPRGGFELIEDADIDIDIEADPELDELEAEIARELEGL
jgi:hypothetical protein